MRNYGNMNPNMNPGSIGNNIMNGPTSFQPNDLSGNSIGGNISRPPPNQNLMDVPMQIMGSLGNNDQNMQMVCFVLER